MLTTKIATTVAALALSLAGTACTQTMPVDDALREKWSGKTVFDLETKTLEGEPIKLADWKGKALLVVNVASRCGFTRQYEGLEKLHRAWKDKGLVVVGVPCNDFGNQESGSAEQIREFCTAKFNVTFPMLEKQSSKPSGGPDKQQGIVFEYLGFRTEKLPGWNFCKYLVHPDGTTVEFFESGVSPESEKLGEAIKKAVAKIEPAKPDATESAEAATPSKG